MECHSPPIKRRRVLHADKGCYSESNKESHLLPPNESRGMSLTGNSNTEAVVNQGDAFNNGKDTLMVESSQIECSDRGQERCEIENRIMRDESNLTTDGDNAGKSLETSLNEGDIPPQAMMEGSKLDAIKESSSHVRYEHNKCSHMVIEESTLDSTTESSSQVRNRDDLPSQMVLEGLNLDATKGSTSQVSNEDNLPSEMVIDGSNLDATIESGCQVVNEDNLPSQIVMEGSKLDATAESSSLARNKDNLPSQILGISRDIGCSHSRKKLLVLDINGLVVDIVAHPDEAYKPDTIIGLKAVYKRPYCDEFLKFCFERFNVGVWTSRTRRNIERVLDFLMKDTQNQLLFCWDQSHCTETGFNPVENSDKPLLLKELKKLWEKQDPKLSWNRGVYDESNTLLLDDSPYKALRNPPYTAIFPGTYSYRDTEDTGLGPEGDLRNYLERLAASENVQKFIEQNPFGQQPITHISESWKFYLKVIGATEPPAGPSRSRRKLLIIDVIGLIVDVIALSPEGGRAEGYRADAIHGSRAVFKRPYCDEFLRFCFKRFNVGVWSSTSRYNIEWVVDLLFRDYQQKLLFCWDRSHCTDTGFRTVENINNTLFLKELKKLWENKDPDLPWEIGEYDESNTLLLENHPHKALLNPPNTAIFPSPYRYWMTEDNSLGPQGDLRIYLERLTASEDVQKFVAENPFGQRPIREKNLSWRFYQKVIRAFSSKPQANSSVGNQCKSLSKPKADTTSALATQILLEPKADPTTSSAAQTLLEPETDPSTASAAETLLEPKAEPATTLAGQTLLDPKVESTAVVAAQSLLEPRAKPTTLVAAQASLEPPTSAALPKAELTAVVAAQTLLEPETDTTATLAAQNPLEPKSEPTTAVVGQNVLEPKSESTPTLVGQTFLESKSDFTTASVGQTLLEPRSEPRDASDGKTMLEPETKTTDSVSQTLSETEFDTTASAATTLPKLSVANDNPSIEPVNNGSSGK